MHCRNSTVLISSKRAGIVASFRVKHGGTSQRKDTGENISIFKK
jgi:hypothetical protein